MVEKHFNLDEDEYKASKRQKVLLGLTDRQAYLKGLGIDAKPRRVGRPPRVSSHSLGSDSAISVVHQVGGDRVGFDVEVEDERKRLLARMQARKTGVS